MFIENWGSKIGICKLDWKLFYSMLEHFKCVASIKILNKFSKWYAVFAG